MEKNITGEVALFRLEIALVTYNIFNNCQFPQKNHKKIWGIHSRQNLKFDFFTPGSLIWEYLCRFYLVIGISGRCQVSINDQGG